MWSRYFGAFMSGSILALTLVACGGGGGSAGVSEPGPSPSPQPTASGIAYQVRYIIEDSGAISLEVIPGNGQPVAPPGSQIGAPVAGATVTYPDGSTQAADGSGDFIPAQSAYAQGNVRQLETSPEAQPLVIVSDPNGKASPAALYVSAYNGANVAAASFARRPMSGFRLTASAQPTVSLGGVRALPAGLALFTNDLAAVHVEGIDIDGHAASLQNAQIQWSDSAGGTITAVAGTNEAIYVPPQIAGTMPVIDTITATVSFPGSSLRFTATSRAQVFPVGAGVRLSGTDTSSTGSALASSAALFVQANVPRIFHPFYWLTLADGSATYARYVPANQTFISILGIPPSFPGGAFSYVVANNSVAPNPGQPSMFTSGNAGTSATADLTLPGSPVQYVDTAGLAKNAIPPLVPYLRDAYAGTVDAQARHVYDADSGIQSLLASPPALSSLPSPAAPQPIMTGLFFRWCYQWENLSGIGETLVMEENTASTCSAGGNDAVTVTPGSSPGGYSYVHFFLPTGRYDVGGPTLDPTGGGAALLAESGSWTQSVMLSSGTVTSDSATVQAQHYNQGHQTPVAPAFTEQLAYQYTLNGTGPSALATIQISNDTYSDFANGRVLQQANRTKTQVAPLHGTGGCVSSGGSPVAGVECYTLTGTLTRTYYVSSGTFTKAFAINEKLYGDGSASLTYASQNPGDASYVSLPIAPYAQRISGACLVCSSNLGAVYDLDGATQLASFTISRGRLVQMNLLDDTTKQVVGALAFSL